MQIKDEEALTYPRKLKGDPNRHSKDKYCRFHRDHNHDTADCYDLHSKLKPLLNKGSCRGSLEMREWINPLKSRTHDRIMNDQDSL